MPRRNSPQSPPKYCQYKRTDQAYVRINGRFIYLGPYNSEESREAYRRIVAEWMITGQAPSEEGEEVGISIMELIVQYWQHVEKYYRKNGQPTAEQDSIRSALRRLKMLYGSTQVMAFTPGNLRNVRHQMIDEGLARTNINKLIDRIRRMFRWAESHDMIPQGKWESLRTVEGLARGRSEARETDPVKPVLTEAIEAVRGLVSRQVKAMIDLQLLTGMRPGEVVILRACDIEDLSASVWTYAPETHKTEHHDCDRIIEIGRRSQTIIKGFLTNNTTAYLFSPQDAVAEQNVKALTHRRANQKPNRRMTGRKVGTRYTVASYRRAIHRACDKAFPPPEGLTDDQTKQWQHEQRWSPNQLRHNAATRLRKEFGIDVARAVLGHRSASVTEVYAEIDREKVREAVAKTG